MNRAVGTAWRAEPWAIFCMAVWLTGTICLAVVATQDFFTIDRLLADSPNGAFHEAVKTLDSVEAAVHPTGRELMTYLSSELNRLFFQYWNLAQMAVGILALWFVTRIRGVDRAKWCIVGMLGVALFMMVILTPPIISVGRSLDFVARDNPTPEVVSALRKFGLLHVTYTVFTLINVILGILATLWIQKPKQT